MYERLDALLNERGITAYRLAKDLGISQSSLSEWKRGNSIPKHERLVKIAAYFSVPVSYLSGRDNDDIKSEEDALILSRLLSTAGEKLDTPDWSDEQARLNLELFSTLTEDKKLEALRYLRYLVNLLESEE